MGKKFFWRIFSASAFLSLLLFLLLGVSACRQKEDTRAGSRGAGGSFSSDGDDGFSVAFIYISIPGDLGWTYEHDRARKMVEKHFGEAVETTFVENVPEGPEAARIIRKYALNGHDMIFATSFGYMDFMHEVAGEFPNVYFEHCSGYRTRDNMASYFGRMYQARYLSGLVAGKSSGTGKIGYVAAFPIPEVIRGINAFTLGVRMVNPDAAVHVEWTHTWYDPVKERAAAMSLLDRGCDLITQHQDTTEPQKAAMERGFVSIGYDSDMGKFVGDTVLVSPLWNWGPYYIERISRALEGTWESHSYWGGLKDGVVQLSSFSPRVSPETIALVDRERTILESGQRDVFHGPLRRQDGSPLADQDEAMEDAELLTMDFFVEGVVGDARGGMID